MMIIEELKPWYKDALENEEFQIIDEIIARKFWEIKAVQKAFETIGRYIQALPEALPG